MLAQRPDAASCGAHVRGGQPVPGILLRPELASPWLDGHGLALSTSALGWWLPVTLQRPALEHPRIFCFTPEVFLQASRRSLALSPPTPRSCLFSLSSWYSRALLSPGHLGPGCSLPSSSPRCPTLLPATSDLGASLAPSSCAACLLRARHVTLESGMVSQQALHRAEHLQGTG